MRPKSILIIFFLISLIAIIVALLNANSASSSMLLVKNSIVAPTEAQVVPTQAPPTIDQMNEPMKEEETSQDTPYPDGPSLVEERCSQCHQIRWFKKVMKTRTEWEAALTKMEKFNVQLSNAEKTILLDYLAVVKGQNE